MKIYKSARAAAREVAAYAAVPGHDNIVRLLDVGAAPGQAVFAAFELHDSPLSALTQAEAGRRAELSSDSSVPACTGTPAQGSIARTVLSTPAQ